MNSLDISLFRWLNSWAGMNPLVDNGIIFKAHYLPYIAGTAAVLFFFFYKDEVQKLKNCFLVLEIAASGIFSRFFVVEIIRFFWQRLRPFEALSGVTTLIEHPQEASFPSGHAAFFFALGMTIFFRYRKSGLLFLLIAFSISINRVAAGVHWPSDVVAGAVVGIVSSYAVHYGKRFLLQHTKERIARLLLSI